MTNDQITAALNRIELEMAIKTINKLAEWGKALEARVSILESALEISAHEYEILRASYNEKFDEHRDQIKDLDHRLAFWEGSVREEPIPIGPRILGRIPRTSSGNWDIED